MLDEIAKLLSDSAVIEDAALMPVLQTVLHDAQHPHV